MPYTIQSGDTLSALAREWGTTVSAIMDANPQLSDPNVIKAGATLVVPGGGEAAEQTPAAETAGPTSPSAGVTKHGVPGDPEVWESGGQHYLVYYVPDTDPPIPLIYAISETDLQAMYGPGQPIIVDLRPTAEQIADAGAIEAGSSTELANFTEEPFDAWASMVEKQAAVRPYLRDPEVLAVIAEALIEGRTVTQAEFEQTSWWQTHNAAERQWLVLFESDPASAQQMLEDNRMLVRTTLESYGVAAPPDSVVDYIASQWVSGAWSDTYATLQMRGLSDPYSNITLDAGLGEVLGDGTIDTTRQGEMDVELLVQKWLGPTFGDWNEQQIKDWAGKIRNDPDAEAELVDYLKRQRMALFPEYENDNLTYDDIAAPWRSFFQQSWGQTPDETDALFQQLVRTNDAAENGKLLRKEGLNRGIGQVVQSAQSQMLSTFGNVRRPV